MYGQRSLIFLFLVVGCSLCFHCCFGDAALIPDECDDPDCGRSLPELLSSKGYPNEWVNVTTADGYILGLIHILHGRVTVQNPTRKVFFLQHGLEDCAMTWGMNFPSQSLAFLLADAGHDVWLGNSRGNSYSLGHTTLSPDSEEYWDFSWDEMAAYDVPACIDAVLNRTSTSSLIWVGHSQGTMISFAGLIRNPAYQDKVSLLVQLAPVAYLKHMDSLLLRWLATFDVDVIIEKLGVKRFLPHRDFYELLGADLCDPLPHACDDFLSVLTGYPEDVNNTRLQIVTQYDPAGTSVKNLVHYGQAVRDGRFAYFDYGYFGNRKIYGTHKSPEYDLSTLRTPTMLFSGTNDVLADPKDVATLKSQLPSSTVVFSVEISPYSRT